MTTEIDENLCPLCGQDNNCLNVKCGGGPENNCWCNDKSISFPPELTDQVPDHARRKACICHACAVDCMDTGGRATQEQLPKYFHSKKKAIT